MKHHLKINLGSRLYDDVDDEEALLYAIKREGVIRAIKLFGNETSLLKKSNKII